MTERLRLIPTDRMHLWLMMVLTFTTGINDAVGYLGLDKVFTGNMTGNVVVLGMALTGDTGLPVLGPALALVGFLGGAALGGRVLKGDQEPWSARTTGLFALVAIIMVALAALLLTAGEDPSRHVMVTTTTIAAVAMGTQAAAARHIAVKDVTTVVVTSTLTGLAADSPFGSGRSGWLNGGTSRRFVAVAVILLGALAGAFLLKWHLGAGLLAAGVVIGTATVIGAWHQRAVRAVAA
ncbi:YoaK family protein [Nocardioides sp. KR10-350]|uniref:YoaK family protein n=1 Tax=Nocardioides cheoyonin TaxID=3156615 RepID=UPI0032B4EBD7